MDIILRKVSCSDWCKADDPHVHQLKLWQIILQREYICINRHVFYFIRLFIICLSFLSVSVSFCLSILSLSLPLPVCLFIVNLSLQLWGKLNNKKQTFEPWTLLLNYYIIISLSLSLSLLVVWSVHNLSFVSLSVNIFSFKLQLFFSTCCFYNIYFPKSM